jgi:membrane protease YdiL (CAAX protease family)
MTDTLASSPDRDVRRRDAVREISIFLGVTFGLLTATTVVGLAQDVDVTHIDEATPLGQAAMYSQAFFPILGTVLARLSTPRDRRTSWGFRRTSARTLGFAWLVGLSPLVAFALCLLAGVVDYDSSGLGPIVPLGLTLLVLPYIPLAIGEDVGWRGLLTTRLADVAGPRVVLLLTGVVWGAFHWPLIIWLGGAPDNTATWYAVIAFTVGTITFGALLTTMQLRWGLWPVVLTHAVSNAAMYHVIDPVAGERAHTGYFIGECGIVGAVLSALVVLLWWRTSPLVRSAQGGTTVRPLDTDHTAPVVAVG